MTDERTTKLRALKEIVAHLLSDGDYGTEGRRLLCERALTLIEDLEEPADEDQAHVLAHYLSMLATEQRMKLPLNREGVALMVHHPEAFEELFSEWPELRPWSEAR